MERHQLAPGTEVGPYVVQRAVAGGGFGEVYYALHAALERPVALKVLHRRLAEHVDIVRRFMREAQTVASIPHPSIVRLYDAGFDVERHQLWIAMEMLDGIELRERIYKMAPVGVDLGLRWGAQIAEVLAAIHEKGIIHRDLKPGNVFVVQETEGEQLKLLDFGVAKIVRPDDGQTILTQTGEAVGTPMYMAPEQFRDAKRVDHRADIYSFGALLYEVFTRRAPLVATTYPEMVALILSEHEPPPLRKLRPDLPRHVHDLIHKAMAKDPAGRFQTARELLQALQAAPKPRSRRSRGRFGSTLRGPSGSQSQAPVSGLDATVLAGDPSDD